MARLECPQMLQHLNEGLLDKVLGVGCVTGPLRQTAVCPPAQWGDVACKKGIDGELVAGPGTSQQIERRLALYVIGRITRSFGHAARMLAEVRFLLLWC